MPATPNLDRLLELVGVLGADAAWLLRGSMTAELKYVDSDEDEQTLLIHDDGLNSPAVLVARFPADDLADWGLTELRLPPRHDREIQAAALISAAIDALSRLGPSATIRVLKWAFARYGIEPANYDSLWKVRDRRPTREPPVPPPEPATSATTRLDPLTERGEQLRWQRVELGVSQAELAGRVGLEIVTRAQISNIERGKLEVDDAVWSQIELALIELRKERAP